MFRNLISVCLFVVISFTEASSQSADSIDHTTRFLNHLRINKLYQERLWFLNSLDTTLAKVSVEKAWTYHSMRYYESAKMQYQNISLDSISVLGFSQDYTLLLFKLNEFSTLRSLSDSHKMDIDGDFQFYIDLLQDTKRQRERAAPDYLLNHYKAYRKLQSKSLFKAGLYSAALPGSGKLYYKQKHQALNMFLVVTSLGLQSYESFEKRGVTSPRFIVFGALFSWFYISNIYGAVVGLKKARVDKLRQIHYEILYHNSAVSTYPH